MKPPPDDHRDLEPPMTRALHPTDADGEAARGPEWTEEEATRRQPPTSLKTEAAFGSHSSMGVGNGVPPPTGGSPGRGVSGKIEPKQVLYSKYQVIKKLGGGAMGDVWLVHHTVLKNLHALKLIVSNIASNEVALMRFQREFEVMASLNHPHAVRIYDACIDEDGGFIDMEYVEGQTLHDLLTAARRRPDLDPSAPLMPLPWIVRILDQLTDVLQDAHEKGIVHRDLKPSNLMLLDGKKPGKEALKVLDFGIAKIRDDPDNAANMTLTQGFIGTPSYGSPEQAMSRQDIDGRADLYSVGVMLYEFVTGRLPFKGVHFQVMHQHAMVPPPPFLEANPALRPLPELERVILRALAKDREERPQTARDLFDEVYRAVEDILGPEALRPPPPSGTSEAVRIPRTTPPPTDMMTANGQAGGPLYAGGPDTLPITASDAGIGRARPPEPSTSRGREASPAVAARPARPRRGLLVGLLALGLASSLGGVLVWSLPRRPPVVPYRPRPIPEGYEAMVGFERPDADPLQLRRKADEAVFKLFAPGIYLPDGYEAVDKDDLVDGWPRLIRREGDPTHALFVRIPGDREWTMGDWNAAPDARQSDAPAHPVVLRSGFYIQKTEVTNGQFEDFLKVTGHFKPAEWEQSFNDTVRDEGPDEARKHPAVNISRKMAVEYARFASAMLPTEAQWEYAARSLGERRPFVWKLDTFPDRQAANIDRGDKPRSSPVGIYSKDVTDQGLYDMIGNVKEMCRDVWKPYAKTNTPAYDPWEKNVDSAQPEYVIRGGDFNATADNCKVTLRDDHRPEGEFADNLGFRPVVECPDSRPADRPR